MSATRDFLGTIIASGLELEMLSPDDVIAKISMDVLAHHLPVELKVRLLRAALKEDAMTAGLVLDTLGVEGIVENAPPPLLWQVVESGAKRSLGEDSGVSSSAVKPALSSAAKPAVSSASVPSVAPARVQPGPRKPNISARPRVRAGATSRPVASPVSTSDEDSAFDVDTRVGAEASDFDIVDETAVFSGDDVTAHGKD